MQSTSFSRPPRRSLGRPQARRKYDYREHWMAFTSRMSGLRRSDEVGARLVEDVMQASGATSAAVYLAEPGNTFYRLTANLGGSGFVETVDGAAPVPSWLRM